MTTKEINDIKELRKEINKIKKEAGVKSGELSVRTHENGYGLSVSVEVKKNTPTAAAAVKAIVDLEHGDKEDNIMTDYFGGNHLSVYWNFEYRESDELREWYVSDQDVEMVKKVLKQKPGTIEEISDKTSASWDREPTMGNEKGFPRLTIYKTEGLERLTSFETFYDDEEKQIYLLASSIARYSFINEI